MSIPKFWDTHQKINPHRFPHGETPWPRRGSRGPGALSAAPAAAAAARGGPAAAAPGCSAGYGARDRSRTWEENQGFSPGKTRGKGWKRPKTRWKARKQWENQGKPWNEWVEIDRKQNEWVTCLNHKKYLSMGDEHLPI